LVRTTNAQPIFDALLFALKGVALCVNNNPGRAPGPSITPSPVFGCLASLSLCRSSLTTPARHSVLSLFSPINYQLLLRFSFSWWSRWLSSCRWKQNSSPCTGRSFWSMAPRSIGRALTASHSAVSSPTHDWCASTTLSRRD